TTLPGLSSRKVVVLPTPPADFEMPDTTCVERPFVLIDRSDSIYKNYNWYFEGGDSILSPNKVVTYTYYDTGLFKVRYYPTYPPGSALRACYDSAEKNIY